MLISYHAREQNQSKMNKIVYKNNVFKSNINI